MTPAARVQAAIDLLDAILAAAESGGAPADSLIAAYFKTRRYAGSKDRRAVRDLVYAAIRRSGDRPVSGRAAMLGVAQDDTDYLTAFGAGGPHDPAEFVDGEPVAAASAVPKWMQRALHPLVDGDEAAAMMGRAPLDLRINRLSPEASEVAAAFLDAEAVAGLPDALRLPADIRVIDHPLYFSGAFEVQDAASQLASLAVGAKPGQLVVDLCAGAGGKALAIASAMRGMGRIIAADTNRARLSKLDPRSSRARASLIETRLLNPGQENAMLADLAGQVDRVIIDAPCSGSGTWRRSPELRWRLDPKRLAALVAEQARLLDIGAALVTPGGAMLYAVCAVTRAEGEDQIAAFLADNDGWSVDAAVLPDGIGRRSGAGWLLTPKHDATDGFFMARLVRH